MTAKNKSHLLNSETKLNLSWVTEATKKMRKYSGAKLAAKLIQDFMKIHKNKD